MKEITHIFFVAVVFHYLFFGYVDCKGCRTSPLWMVWPSQARTRTSRTYAAHEGQRTRLLRCHGPPLQHLRLQRILDQSIQDGLALTCLASSEAT